MLDKIMLFPGQGAQFVGMGKALYNTYPLVRQTYEEAGDRLGFDVADLCFNGPAEKLKQTANAQVAILTTSVAAFRQFQAMYHVNPAYCAGHSLGEYSALVCAEAASFSDILQLVQYRGELMAEAGQTEKGTMAAVEGVTPAIVTQICDEAREQGELVWIAAYNMPQQVVISGSSQSVERVAKQCENKGARIVPLSVTGAFHTPRMTKAADALRDSLFQMKWRMPKFPVISNVTAAPYSAAAEIPERLASQMVMPVRWNESLAFALGERPVVVLAFPPKNSLANMIQQDSNEIRVFSFQSEEDWISYGTYARGAEVDLLARMLAVAVSTKNYSEDLRDYEERAVYPYRCLEDMHAAYLSGKPLTTELIDQALEWLASILAAKKLSEPKRASILLEMRRLV